MSLPPERIRLSDVAKRAGVSNATASKALNNTGRMTEETRSRVQQVAAELGFRPNAMARALISQRSFTVGMLTNDSYGRFTMPVMEGVTEELVDDGVSVFLCSMNDDAELGQVHVRAMIDKQVDGIICTGKRIDKRLPVDLSEVSVPIVYVFTDAPSDAVSLVSDDAQGARDATRHLLESDCKNLLHISGPETFASARERAGAFGEVAGPDAPILFGEWSEAWGHKAISQIWSGDGPKPDGIFCGNDQIARGVIDALREIGVDVPRQVSVVGFDNWEIVSTATRPPLTSVELNLKDLGRKAGRLVMQMSNGDPVAPGLRRLPCDLVFRSSCRSDEGA
ncbi:MAG: LacI family DNA-binding transcriptional regulator [Marinosulfonomonas sp.]